MNNQIRNLFKSIRQGGIFLGPGNFEVTHRLDDINGLGGLVDDYDLILLDRDCTLQPYHGTERVPEFEEILRKIAPMAEIVSNSSFRTFLGIKDVFGDLIPASKLVRLSGFKYDHLLRVNQEGLKIFGYSPHSRNFGHGEDGVRSWDNVFYFGIEHDYDKPDPLALRAVIDWNVSHGRVCPNPRVLMVGDAYLTDIVAGNLAGVDTARVKPHKPISNPWYLILMRSFDSAVGTFMSRDSSYDL